MYHDYIYLDGSPLPYEAVNVFNGQPLTFYIPLNFELSLDAHVFLLLTLEVIYI